MKNFRKIVSVLALIVLVGSDFLTSFSYAIEEIVENTEVIQTEMGEVGENEGKTLNQNDEILDEEVENNNEENYEDKNIEEETEEKAEDRETQEEISQGNEETLQGLSGENIDDEVIDDKMEDTEEEKSEIEIARETLNENVIEKSEKYNNVVVNVSAKEGTFPEGTYVDIEAVRGNQLEEVRQQISDENNNILEESEIVAFDIKFLYELSDGTVLEVQPKNGESVKVSFDYSDNTELEIADKDETKEIQVYHINDKDESGEYVNRGEEKVEKIEINQEESKDIENGVVIDAEKFSVYALVLIEGLNPTQYTLTLDPRGGSIVSGENITINEETGTGTIFGTILSEGGSVTLPLAVRENHEFLGWYTAGEIFAGSGGDLYEITGDITLYAKWQEDEGVMYTVTFDANRGTFANLPTPQTVVNGSLISAPTQQQTPELSGYTFTGWWTEPRDGTQWDFAKDVVTGNITLYAHWTYNEIFGELDVYMIDSNKNLTKKVMMDRNLGASARYDRLDFTNPNFSSLGFAYQWGNNWGFTRCANNTLCHGEGTPNPDTISQAVSDWIGHVPSKYASKKFHGKNASNYAGGTWISNNNGDDGNDLWGLETGTPEARQGPCPDGYYLPSGDDYNTLYTKWKDIRGYSKLETDDEIRDFTEDFLFPLAGSHKKGRFYEYDQGLCADYWTNSLGAKVNATSANNFWFCRNKSNNYKGVGYSDAQVSPRNNGSTVRCFRDSTNANLEIDAKGGKQALITIIKEGNVSTIDTIKEPIKKTADNIDLVFSGWYTTSGYQDGTKKVEGDTLSVSETTLYAKWDCPEGLVYNVNNQCVSGVLVRFMDGETEYTRSVVLLGEEVSAPAINPIKAGYIFTGWFESGANLPFVFTGTPITGNLDLYAHWEELPETEVLITVNYYLKNLDVENNVLTGGVIKYSTGVEFIGEIGDTINISGTYLTGIVGYYFDHATVFSGEDEILADEIYLEGNKEINMYYIPEQNQFTLNTVPYSSTEGSSTGGMYYYGAKVILSGASSDDHYLWSGWIGLPGGTPNSAQTEFYMPNSAVSVTSSVREKIYNEYTVTFENRNGSVLWSGKVISGEIPVYSGNTPLRPATEETVFTFEGWYPEINPVTGNTTYIAVYTESPRSYTVTLTGTPAGYGTLSPELLSKEYGAAIVISGDRITIGGTEVTLTGNEGYEFQEWTGNCGKAEKQVCDEFIVYSHPDPIEFTGSNNIVITSEGYDLFSQSGYQKDFEISFDILNLNLTGSSKQATLLSVKNEDLNNQRPGISFRRKESTSNLELTARGGAATSVAKTYTASNVHSVKISREKGKLYIAINGGNKEEVDDYSNFTNYFDKPITIGSIYQNGGYDRYIKATLSNILIKTIDTTSCYTGNVYVVTGDCQMTARYANWIPSEYAVTGNVAAGQENMGYLSGATSTGVSLTGLYEYGKNLVFIAVPEIGYVFDYWMNGDTVLSGTDLGDGTNQLTVVVNQILDIIAFFKPAENTPYTVEHYKQNLDQTGYEFAWSGTMYGTTNGLTNATGTDYEGFTLSGDLVGYQTGVKADGSTIVKLYYNRNTYTVTRNMWEGHLNRRKIDKNVPYGTTPIFEWDDEDKYTPKRGREVDTDDIKYDFIFTGWIKSGSTEIIKDLTMQIVTGNVTYTAQYDTEYRYYEVRYHTDEGTGTMEPQSLQLYSSGTLNKNKFIRTGYIFSGWWYEYSDGIEVFYEDEQEINLGVEDGVLKSGGEWEDPLYLDVYAQWKPSTGTKIKVNCYARELDKNLKELSPEPKYLIGTEHTGKTDSGINVIDYSWECMNISGYNIGHGVSGAIIYGSDFPDGILTGWDGTTTILADGSRVINVYIAPKIDSFIINESDNCGYKGDPSGYYYYGSKIYLEADPYECYSFSGWSGSGLPDGFDRTSAITEFFMPHAIVVNLTPTVRENKYNIVFSGNGSTSGTMSDLSVLCTSGTLSQNTFEREGYTFAGRSTTSTGTVEFSDESEVYRLNTEDNGSATLYAVWNINNYEVTGSIAEGQENMGYLSGNTGTGISLTGLYDYGTELIFIAVPELGYLFDYWEVTGSGDSQPIVTESGNQLTVIVDQILDIIAHFTENVKTVTINYYEMNTGGVYPNDPYNTDSFTGLVGQTKSINPESRLGFHLDSDRSNTGVTISENSEDNVINIYYARDKHYITLGYSGAFVYPNSVEVVPVPSETGYYYGESVHFEAIVSTGYVFKQWKVNGNPVAGNADGVDFVVGTNDINLIVDGYPISYHIFYHGIGGSDYPDNPNYYTALSGMFSIIDPVKTGYTFLGWTGGVTGDWISTPTSGLTIDVTNGLGDREYYANWETHEKNIVVNYYEMDTSGNYIYDPNHDYPNEHYYYTGLVDSSFTVPDYSKTGFSFHYSIFRGNTGYNEPVTFEVSENDSENIINVYYQRARNSLQIYSNNGSKYDVGPNCQSYDGGYTHSCSYYYGTEIAINNYIYEYDEGYSFSGWNIDSASLPDDAYLSDEHINFSMPDHSVIIRLETNHILYKLTFTGYEGAEVMNYDSTYVSLTGENYYRFDSEIELPYLDKPGYNFVGWNEGNSNVWSVEYTSYPYHPIWNMPSHDVELTAVFEPKTNMEYNEYYYLQDVEGTGYSRDDELTQRKYDGTTEQQIPYPYPQKYITGFEYTGFGYDEKALRPWEEWPTIKATGDNYINYYYDRKVDGVYVEYDAKKMSVVGTGEYRYGAPVTLTATVKTGYEFSGFTSYQGELLTSGSVYDFTMPDSYVYLYANADPIVYSIEYEMDGGWLAPYQWYKTGYTVDGDFDLDIFDAIKDGYIFLGWTGGEIGVRELTEPTTGLVIPLGSTGNRKYFANFEATGSNITVNYYLKKIDPENNVLTGGSDVYKESVIYTGLTDSVVDIQSLYGTGIEGYSYTTAIVYGSDLSGGVETGTTTILGDQSRVIDIYYTPKKYDFTVIEGSNTTTSGTSNSTGYYLGAYVTLSGNSTDNCFEWEKWGSSSWPEGVENDPHTTFAMPAHNVTVESMVKEKSYNITFDANGGSGTMETLPVQCTSGTLIANSFERDGYTFTGWSRNSGGPVEFTDETDVHRLSTESGGSVTLYAVWDANLYTVTFDLNGGKLTGDMTFTTGYTIETHAISLDDYIPYKSGYIFTGWYRGDNLVNSIAGGETGDYTLTANWEGDIVFLHISYLGKTLDGADYYIMSETGDFPKVGSFYEAEIKDFSGFTYDPTEPRNITGMIVSYDSGQNDIQIYYKRDEYPLIINYDDTISEISGSKEFFYYEEPVTLTIKPFTGWNFVNWIVIEGDLSGVDLSGTTLSFNMPAEQVKVSPNLNHTLYTLSFDSVLGTAVEESQTYYYNDNLSVLDNAITTRTGYDFDGWYLSGVLYTSGSTMPAENITLTAKWTPRTGIQYQVNHWGENIGDKDYTTLLSGYTMYGTSDTQTIAENGNFVGFTLSGDVKQENINPDGTTVVDIYYNRNVYTITLNNNGGNGVTEITGKYEASVTVQEPTRTGYNFAGWDPDIPSTMPLSGWSATAKWNPGLTQYTVNYHIEKVQTGEYDIYTGVYIGETDSSPWIPLYPYSLTGFIKPNQFTGKIIPGGTEFDYYYYRNSYMLYYDTAGGTPLSGRLFRYGEKILTGETERPGYTLIRWDNIPDDGNMPAQSGLTLVALWEPNANTNYTVYHYFEDLSGRYITGEEQTLSGTTDTPTAATPKHVPGYKSDFDTTSGQVNIDGDGKAIVEIYYDRIVYQIDFDMNGGNAIEGTGVKFGTYIKSFIDSLNPHKQGYAFSGWNPEFPTTMPDHNLTGMAIWSPATGEYKIEFYYQLADGRYPGTATSGEFRIGNTEWTGRVTDSDKQPVITGYAFDSTNTGNVLEGEVVGDGSLILKVYFKKQFTVRYLTGLHGTFSEDIHSDLDYGIGTPAFRGNTGSHDPGYTFIGWSPELVEIVTGDASYEAQWMADSDTLYSVEYYKQNLSGGYDVWTGIYTGETDVNVAALVKSFTGFTYSGGNPNNETSGVIAGDGSLVLKLFYDRNKYTITWKDGNNETLKTEDVFYEATPIYSGVTPTKTATAQYSYTFNNTWTPTIESITTGATYTAQFASTVNEYTVSIVPSDTDMGTVSPSEIDVSYGATIVESGNTITIGGVEIEAIPNPADVQYTYEFDSWTNTCGSELAGTCTIQANFKKILNKCNITWKDDNGNVIDTTMVEYGATPTHSKPIKPETEDYRYVFVGWMPELVAVTGDAEYTATFTAEEKEQPSKGGSMSGGGGRKSSIDDSDNTDNQHGSAEENSDLFTGDYYTSSGNIDDETLSLYEWAHENDITTIDTFVEANADGYLTRGHMAKMAVKFAEIVLGKTVPDTYPAECNWNDKESERESQEIKIYAKKACALGVMGINVDEFMPNKILNRAEFGTTVSRLLRGDKYNITDTDHRSYYEDHLYALKKQGIMTQINDPEDRRELRKWVRLVFRRMSGKLKK